MLFSEVFDTIFFWRSNRPWWKISRSDERDRSSGFGIGCSERTMIVFVNSSLEVSRDTSIESIVSAEEDVGVSHEWVNNEKFLYILLIRKQSRKTRIKLLICLLDHYCLKYRSFYLYFNSLDYLQTYSLHRKIRVVCGSHATFPFLWIFCG